MPEGLAGWVIATLAATVVFLAGVVKVIFDRFTDTQEKRLADKDAMIERYHAAIDAATKADMAVAAKAQIQNERLKFGSDGAVS